MKNILLLAFTVTCLQIFSQAPQGMNYQATVRDNSGNILPGQMVGLKFILHQGSAGGTVVYTETDTPTTDQFGGISLVIGQGNVVSGNFSSIHWASGVYYNEVLMDITGGTNYTSMGNAQLMSVPYAFYANQSGAVVPTASQNFVVRINGVPIADSTLDFALITPNVFLTKTNYIFSTEIVYPPNNPQVDSMGWLYVMTDDTIAQSNVYLRTYLNSTQQKGRVFRITNGQFLVGSLPLHDGEIWYVPLNATPVQLPVGFEHNNSTLPQPAAQYTPYLNSYYYQAYPNDPLVTGVDFPNGLTIQYSRQ